MSVKSMAALLLAAIVAVALGVSTPAPANDEPTQAVERIANLKQDISILNLLNGLHLTDQQCFDILAEARTAQGVKDRYLQDTSEKLSRAAESLEALKRQLMDPQAPPPRDIEQEAKRNNTDLKRLHESYIREIAAIEGRVADILTDGQKQILVDFKPCLLPPKNLKDPDRAGQAQDHSHIEKVLSRSRTWPDDVYERRLESFLDKFTDKVEERLGPMSKEERLAEKNRVRAIVEEAHSMSDVDFELSKQELAERIDIYNGKQKHKTLVTEHKNHGQIARFLLSERAVPILEQRVELAAGGTKFVTTSQLDSIKPAENCREACGSNK